ncbi:MAG: DUF92 domain-containing protein [Methanomassiliicoccales archaeon]|nr:DUF92 domain-containing protein [Methanomassiliicoccales archaeon]
MSPLENLGVILGLCAILSLLAFRFKLLTLSGSIAAFAVGVIIGWFGSISWLLVLIVFTLLGFAVTRYKLKAKIDSGLQEGRRGERTYRNVLANSLVPAAIAIISWLAGTQADFTASLVYLSAISVAAADTTASELGILSPNAFLITTFERVRPGTDGAVSGFGTLAAAVASAFASLLGWLILLPDRTVDIIIFVPMLMGFLGCMVDSLVGATLERKQRVSKLGNNIISMAVGSLLAWIIILLV